MSVHWEAQKIEIKRFLRTERFDVEARRALEEGHEKIDDLLVEMHTLPPSAILNVIALTTANAAKCAKSVSIFSTLSQISKE